MYTRETTRQITVGNLKLGGQNRVLIQSMCNTPTKDVDATVSQINRLAAAGCQIIRVAVLDKTDAESIAEIKKRIGIPLVCDIHFDYRLALRCIEQGCDKVRINPGNIGSKENVRKVVEACRERHIPIRIGINSGSLEKEVLEKYGVCPQAMLESARRHVEILEELDFTDICLSFKSSNVPLTISTYLQAAEIFPYPLHIGLTEAGTKDYSLIKSSAALGSLLYRGLGDTLRISISDDPIEEVLAARKLLKAFDLIHNEPDLISCPTCGRTQWDFMPAIREISEFLKTIHKDIKVAVMGCVVNGPGEAREADIGIAGSPTQAIIFRHGRLERTVPITDVVSELKKEILEICDETD